MGNRGSFLPKGLIICLAVGLVACPFIVKWFEFKDNYLFLTIEESSLNALTGWPMSFSDIPGVFIDAHDQSLILREDRNLAGVILGVYYTAVSQGIEFDEKLLFSRTGKASLDLLAPSSFMVSDMDGTLTELVDNNARILKGNLKVKKTHRNGTVEIQYGDDEIVLKPGESWAEMLVLGPDGVRAISHNNWEEEVDTCLSMGYPVTRLAIANRGLWPKSKVEVGMYP